MSTNLSELAALIKLLRESGVTRYKCGDLELVLEPSPLMAMTADGIPVASTPKKELDPVLKAALDRLPAAYRDERAFTFGQ